MTDNHRSAQLRLDCRYDRIGELADPCTYCGLPATSWDHIPPLHFAARLTPDQLDHQTLRKIPCCHECNTFLGGILLTTLTQRRSYVKERIRRKYRAWAQMPDWSHDELAQLSTEDAKRYIASHARFARLIAQRLEFYSKRTTDALNATESHSVSNLYPRSASEN